MPSATPTPSLIAALSKAAGIDAEVKPPTKEEMDELVADVAAKGNAARGERIFRRADLNCMKCHAIAGRGRRGRARPQPRSASARRSIT